MTDNEKKYKELIKDFGTDEDLVELANEITQRFKQMHCFGLASFTSPLSEKATFVITTDVLNATFLLKALIQEVGFAVHQSPTSIAATLMWYLAQVETRSILEEEKIFKKSLVGKAEEFAFWSLKDVIYKSQHADFLEGTPIANQITMVD